MKIKNIVLSGLCFFYIGTTCLHAQTVTDIDSNVYKTVVIGTQVWMAENLKTTRYRNGDTIPVVPKNPIWSELKTGACFEYPGTNGAYGKLYNFFAVTDSAKLCPAGWHVPSVAEWSKLTDFLGGKDVAGGKLKEKGKKYWQKPNTGATDKYDFKALAGGARLNTGICSFAMQVGMWWSSSSYNAGSAYAFSMAFNNDIVYERQNSKAYGSSVRCVKD